jgi:hypothetical protein
MRVAQGFANVGSEMLGIMSRMIDCLTQSRVTVNRASLNHIQITRDRLNDENLSRNAIETFIAPRVLDMPNPYLRPAPFAPRLRVYRHDGIGPERARKGVAEQQDLKDSGSDPRHHQHIAKCTECHRRGAHLCADHFGKATESRQDVFR